MKYMWTSKNISGNVDASCTARKGENLKAVRLENLTKYYGKARGVIELNLDVEEGAFFGFIGPNGAGKSTTIRTMLGLIAPSGGSAKVLGMDIVKDRNKIFGNHGCERTVYFQSALCGGHNYCDEGVRLRTEYCYCQELFAAAGNGGRTEKSDYGDRLYFRLSKYYQ